MIFFSMCYIRQLVFNFLVADIEYFEHVFFSIILSERNSNQSKRKYVYNSWLSDFVSIYEGGVFILR